jgi:hypothetical protein
MQVEVLHVALRSARISVITQARPLYDTAIHPGAARRRRNRR